jgi:hypothetical protein
LLQDSVRNVLEKLTPIGVVEAEVIARALSAVQMTIAAKALPLQSVKGAAAMELSPATKVCSLSMPGAIHPEDAAEDVAFAFEKQGWHPLVCTLSDLTPRKPSAFVTVKEFPHVAFMVVQP